MTLKHTRLMAGILTCCLSAAALGQNPDLDTTTFDRNVRPQDDLYLHVNGTWLQNTEIPADKSNFGSFVELADLSQKRIKELIEELSSSEHAKGTDEQKVGDFYRSFMNEELVNEKGIDPLKDRLAAIDKLNSHEDVFKFFGDMQQAGVKTPVAFFVSQDAKNSTQYLVQIIQSGTSLPDRDYYLKDEENLVAARAALKVYIAKLYELAAIEDGEGAADEILALETKLAEAQWPRVELRQADKRYNIFTLDELSKARSRR